MNALYEITTDILKIGAILDELEGSDQNDEDLESALNEALEQANGDLAGKVENIVMLLRNWEGRASMIKAEEQRLAKNRKALESKVSTLRGYLLSHLQRVKAPKLELTVATVSRKAGSERVEIDDDMALPQGYFEIESDVKPDKVALKKLWKETPEDEREALPGFHVERGPESLTIK